jgi:hypothetical protein
MHLREVYEQGYVNWTEIAQDRVKEGAFVNNEIKRQFRE